MFHPSSTDPSELDGRIITQEHHGQHITLTCVNHPQLRWSTKNIAPIGARSIFYKSWDDAEECECPIGELRPIDDYAGMPSVTPSWRDAQ